MVKRGGRSCKSVPYSVHEAKDLASLQCRDGAICQREEATHVWLSWRDGA